MPRLNFTCKGCPDRYPGCHGKCEKYIRERAEYDRLKAAEDQQRRVDEYTARNVSYCMDQKSRETRYGLQWKSGGFKK